MAEETVKNILVIGPSWVGDMVMSQALFMCLKKENPDSQITVMAPNWTRPLLDRMPEVDSSMDMVNSVLPQDENWVNHYAVPILLRP